MFPDQTVFSSDDFSLLRHSRQQQHQHQAREYLTMNVEQQQPQTASASHINSIQRQQPQRPRRSSIEATTNPSSKDLTPPPPPLPIHDVAAAAASEQPRSGGCRLGLGHTGATALPPSVPNTIGSSRHPLVDFCTLRRPPNNRPPPRSVQFADQQNVSNSTASSNQRLPTLFVPTYT